MNKNSLQFKDKYTLQERIEKSKKQMTANPGKLVVIVEKHPKSVLPSLNNPRFICEKDYKFGLIRSMLQKKIKEAGKPEQISRQSFFIAVNGLYPNPCKY